MSNFLITQLSTQETHILHMGGSFDPPHRMHLRLFLTAAEAEFKYFLSNLVSPLDFEKREGHWLFVLMPAAQNPLKSDKPAPASLRIRMLEALLRDFNFKTILKKNLSVILEAHYPNASKEACQNFIDHHIFLIIDRFEVDAEQPSYTKNLCDFYRQYPGIRSLNMVMGLDNLLTFESWKDPMGILALLDRIYVMPREMACFHSQELLRLLSASFSNEKLLKTLYGKIILLKNLPLDPINSTTLRKLLRGEAGSDCLLKTYLCSEELQIIRDEGLYCEKV